MEAIVTAIEYQLGDRVETNDDLAREYPDWAMGRLFAMTGVRQRRLAAPDETAADLAVRAAERLFAAGACDRSEVDYVLFCSQTPDHLLPPTSCSIQHRLGIPQTAGALDFNLGCSGYIYGLSLAKGLVESGQSDSVLLLTADTYSKLIRPADRNVRTVFGDGGAATLVRAAKPGRAGSTIHSFVFGTDGSGAENLIVRNSGYRTAHARVPEGEYLEMNGGEVFNFTLRVVAPCVEQVLARGRTTLDEVALVVPHQANAYMLAHLRAKLGVPKERFVVSLADYGNTVSASIPIALRQAQDEGTWRAGDRVMLLGFGIGYSWGGCLLG